MVALATPLQFGGAPAPIKQASRYFWPQHYIPEIAAVTMTTTGARYYTAPYYIDRSTTLAGAWCYNGGAGDNGDKVKIAAYNQSASGGPGTLAKNFGEVTLTGAAAVRTFASSWSATPGWYYLELVTDNAVTMYCMNVIALISNVGNFSPSYPPNLIGASTPSVAGSAMGSQIPNGEYVGGTYANFPESTSLTPATTLRSNAEAMPFFGLYT